MRGRLGMAYHANGFAEAAIATYGQAAALDPSDFRWPYLRALLEAESGALDAALASLDQALDLDPQRPSAWLWRGTWLLDAGRQADAAVAFRRALEVAVVDAHRVAATSGLARTLLRSDQAAAAAALLEPVAEEFDHPYPRRLLGQAYRRLGRGQEADTAAAQSAEAAALEWPDAERRAVADQVRGFSGRLSQAEELIDQGRPTAALAILEPLRAAHPDDRVLLNNLAVAYGRAGRQDAALAVLGHGLDMHSEYHVFHFNIASAYEERGDAQSALRHLDQAIAAQPSFLPAHEEKIALLVAKRRYDDAMAAIDGAERLGALSPATLFYAGVIAGADERWAAAAERFEQVLRRDAAYPKAHLYLGRALAEAKRFDEAHTAFELAAAFGTPPSAVADARARLAVLRQGAP